MNRPRDPIQNNSNKFHSLGKELEMSYGQWKVNHSYKYIGCTMEINSNKKIKPEVLSFFKMASFSSLSCVMLFTTSLEHLCEATLHKKRVGVASGH